MVVEVQKFPRSFLCGGSVGSYVHGYCLYFYSQPFLSGFLQLSSTLGTWLRYRSNATGLLVCGSSIMILLKGGHGRAASFDGKGYKASQTLETVWM
ncbi:hypothetical protein IMY05_008G0116900 [Salix suchowensis]|nr:hypothetical protein IMY05_008G0116900 [Salix suchowensis]